MAKNRDTKLLVKQLSEAVNHIAQWLQEHQENPQITIHHDFLATKQDELHSEFDLFLSNQPHVNEDTQRIKSLSYSDAVKMQQWLSGFVDDVVAAMQQKELKNIENNFASQMEILATKFPKLEEGKRKLNKLQLKQQKEITKKNQKLHQLSSTSEKDSHKKLKIIKSLSNLKVIHNTDINQLKSKYGLMQYEQDFKNLTKLKQGALSAVSENIRSRKNTLKEFLPKLNVKSKDKMTNHSLFTERKDASKHKVIRKEHDATRKLKVDASPKLKPKK